MDDKKNSYELPANLRRGAPSYLSTIVYAACILVGLGVLVLMSSLWFRLPPFIIWGDLGLLCLLPFVLIGLLILVFISLLRHNGRLKAWVEDNVRCPECNGKVKTTRWPSAFLVVLNTRRNLYNPCMVQCVDCKQIRPFYIGPSTVELLGPSNIADAMGPIGSVAMDVVSLYKEEDIKKFSEKATKIFQRRNIIIIILLFILVFIVLYFVHQILVSK